MEIGLIGRPISGGNFPQGIGFEKLSNDKFSCGPLVVEMPKIQRLQREICNDHLVGISSHLEKGELPRGFLWKETSYHHKALGCFPSPGFVFELRNPESRRDLLVMKTPKVMLDRLGDPGYDGIESWDFLEILCDSMVVEGRVATHANLSYPRGQLRDTSLQEVYCMGSGMDISRKIHSLPYISCFAFETKEGLIGRPSSFLGIVAHFGSFLLAIDSQDFGIEIEDYRGEGLGFH
jgi:hypothetical protein